MRSIPLRVFVVFASLLVAGVRVIAQDRSTPRPGHDEQAKVRNYRETALSPDGKRVAWVERLDGAGEPVDRPVGALELAKIARTFAMIPSGRPIHGPRGWLKAKKPVRLFFSGPRATRGTSFHQPKTEALDWLQRLQLIRISCDRSIGGITRHAALHLKSPLSRGAERST